MCVAECFLRTGKIIIEPEIIKVCSSFATNNATNIKISFGHKISCNIFILHIYHGNFTLSNHW